ncbi:MAG: LPS export ABC transporter permease LptF [Bdellovibrionales bacterium]
MIHRINLYLFRQILTAFLFSGIAVSFVVLFTQSFRLLSFVIDNSSSMAVFFRLMGLMLPTFLPLILPISLGIAVLFIYHKNAVDSEIVVMQAAGISPMRLALPALVMAAATIVVGGMLTLWLTPAANRALVSLQYQVRDEYSAFMIRPGAFNDLAEGLTFYARRRSSAGGLEDILVHDVRNPARPVTIMAQKGLFSVEGGRPQVVVFDGRRQEVDVASGRLQQLDFDRYVLDLHLLKNEKDNRQPAPRELSIGQLLNAQAAHGTSNASLSKVLAEIHQRIAGPFLALTFALMGVTVVLMGDFNRRGMTQRVFWAGAGIVVVQAAMIGLVSQINKLPWMALLLYGIIFLPALLCFTLLRQASLPSFLIKKPKGAA